jgi:hypothetical protein
MSHVASSASRSAGREKATYQSTLTGKGVEDQATGKACGHRACKKSQDFGREKIAWRSYRGIGRGNIAHSFHDLGGRIIGC